MKKKGSFYIILTVVLLSSCIKAYEPIVTAPYTAADVAGTYKNGTLIVEKGFLDSLVYKSTDDTSSFTLSYYYKDTILVSINTKSGVSNKRYKLGLYGTVSNTVASVFKFQSLAVDSTYFLNRQSYDLQVKLYYPEANKPSTATISNNIIYSKTPNILYIENIVFNANLQPK